MYSALEGQPVCKSWYMVMNFAPEGQPRLVSICFTKRLRFRRRLLADVFYKFDFVPTICFNVFDIHNLPRDIPRLIYP